jgi:hypothetical protein
VLIILETSRKEHLIQQCHAMLVNSLTMEQLLDWGLQDAPRIVARRMIDWAMTDDTTVQTMWGQHVDNSGDEPGGVAAACGNANPAAG